MSTDTTTTLPPGWEMRYADDGKPYYLNHITKTTQWNPPSTNFNEERVIPGPSIPIQQVIVVDNKSCMVDGCLRETIQCEASSCSNYCCRFHGAEQNHSDGNFFTCQKH